MRRLAFAAVCGTLVLAACSDQSRSPTEPPAQPPEQTFGTTCDHGRYPLSTVAPLTQDAQIFPTKALRAEAFLRVAAIALLWDTCHDQLARKAAVATLIWIDQHARMDTQDRINREKALDDAILNGFGGSSSTDGDYVAGVYIPNTTMVFTTPSGRATIELRPGAFNEPTLITIRRLPDDFRLSGFPADRQDAPFWDYDATNSHTDNTVQSHTLFTPNTATLAFCYKSIPDGEGGTTHITYPYPGARIGHNPVGGGFEFLDEVPVPTSLQNALTDCPSFALNLRKGSPRGGLRELANVTWSSAGHYLARLARTLFLPAPLRAATVGTTGPIAGNIKNLSPHGIVLPDCLDQYGYYTIFCFDQLQ